MTTMATVPETLRICAWCEEDLAPDGILCEICRAGLAHYATAAMGAGISIGKLLAQDAECRTASPEPEKKQNGKPPARDRGDWNMLTCAAVAIAVEAALAGLVWLALQIYRQWM
ncbi:MAG: hypothetical protein WA708_01845 [Acidobacteriaceae bacterium]